MGLKADNSNSGARCALTCCALALFALLAAAPATAQQEPQTAVAGQQPDASHAWLLPRKVAAALSAPRSRGKALMALTVLARLQSRGVPADAAVLEQRLRADRAWLDRLAAHYAAVLQRDTLFDPSAWFLLLELGQQNLQPGPLVSPLGPSVDALLGQLFERGDEALAAALLPEVLRRIEPESVLLWPAIRQAVEADASLAATLSAIGHEWLGPLDAGAAPAAEPSEEDESPLAAALQRFRTIAGERVSDGPPDAARVERLRFELLAALPGLDAPQAQDAARLLELTTALEGLDRGHYLAFVESLLGVTSSLLLTQTAAPAIIAAEPPEPVAGAEADAPESLPGSEHYTSPLPQTLAGMLPSISNVFAGAFAEVDPRLNAAVAAAYDTLQYLQEGIPDPPRAAALHSDMADAVAQLVLLVPDMDFYYRQPVRGHLSEEIDICISIVAGSGGPALPALSREQFDGCMESMAEMARELIPEPELAGDPDGPFGVDQLQRELMLVPAQRVNYLLGNLARHSGGDCEAPDEPLPNPLEWANLATLVAWFSEQSPVYLQTPENEALLQGLQAQGTALLQAMRTQLACITAAAGGDPVTSGLADYRRALDSLAAGLHEAESEFRSEHLRPGADVALDGRADQATAYRGEELEIGPCDQDRTCGVTAELEATRALVGLFPDEYLIADQTGLGRVEICYDNVQWVDRRPEPVRSDDPNVANYYGRLSFDLIGRYREGSRVTPVWGSKFVSPREYHYLFASASPDVLADSCPLEWIGSRVVTHLPPDRPAWLVPDRLTYLAAARNLPGEVIASNWARNGEWRDSFITGRNVTWYPFTGDPGIRERIEQHLDALYRREQSALYAALLSPRSDNAAGATASLAERLAELDAYKAVVRSYIGLFYPRLLLDSDAVRSLLEGRGGLPDRRVLQRFRQDKQPLSVIYQEGSARLERFRRVWGRQPAALRFGGSVPQSVAHALLRLNAVYRAYFASPAQPAIQEAAPAPGTPPAG